MPGLRVVSFALAVAGAASAQCELQQVHLSQVDGGVNGVATAGGVTYITGYFGHPVTALYHGIAKANCSSWDAVDTGLEGLPTWWTFPPIAFGEAIEPLGDGSASVVVGGQFLTAGGVPASGIAVYDGANWSALGSGVNGIVRALAADGQGGVYVGGEFTIAGGVLANRVAHWNGNTWSALGGGADGRVDAMTVLTDGSLVITGGFANVDGAPAPGIARWNGSSWSTWSGVSVPSSFNYALAAASNGDLFVGGSVVVGGQPASLARWDGSSWHALLPGTAYGPQALEALPDGSVIVQTPSGLSRWHNGTLSQVANAVGTTTSLHANDAGELYVGGVFSTIGTSSITYITRWETPCPAQVNLAGSGCSWSNGAAVLSADTPAWIGGTYRARGTGLPPNALAASVYGFGSTSMPLWNFLPMTGPNCWSHTSADFLELALPSAGEVATDEPLPSDPALHGASFYHQLVVFELNAQGACIGVTSSNALQLTFGVF